MKFTQLLMISACVASMVGCGSSSTGPSTKVTKTPITPSVQKAPLADYAFSDAQLADTLSKSAELLDSVNLSFEGRVYNKALFAEGIDEGRYVIRLQNAQGEQVDLMIDDHENRDCLIAKPSGYIDVFNCDSLKRSTTDDTMLIQSTLRGSRSNIQVEFATDAIEMISVLEAPVITTIGNTQLTTTVNDNHVTIATSFAFEDFFKEVLKVDDSEEDFESALGVTTYLQMKDITTQYEGSSMTLNFANHIAGSMDDDINMYTGLMIKAHNMATVVAQTGSVFSGGTDLFAAGYPRILQRATKTESFEINRQIGIHSWSDGELSAREIPYTHESHRKQATYFDKVLGEQGIDFYLFTLDSAPFDGEYFITKADSDKYGLITTIE